MKRLSRPAVAAAAKGRAVFPTQIRCMSFGAEPRPTRPAWLVLEDGSKFEGVSFGAEKEVASEVVFSTGPTGYVESLTDPSFAGQALVLTQPMIGNYGVPARPPSSAGSSSPSPSPSFAVDPLLGDGLPKNFESRKIHADALICLDYSNKYSHWSATSSLGQWLKENDVPGIAGIDTRALTKKIRNKGVLLGKIVLTDPDAPAAAASSPVLSQPFADPNKRNLVAEVSRSAPSIYGKGNKLKILAVDCGIKTNMIRLLVAKGAEVKVVPWDHDLSKEKEWYDGLFLSNGPGDPATLTSLIAQLRTIVNDPKPKPLFGICLGNQLLGLAAGANTVKLPFGNRGQNVPVLNLLTGQAYITSQNHGFAIDTSTLPSDWKPLFKNLNDGTNEGIIHSSKPFFSIQSHPEAKGGPEDTEFLFDAFLQSVAEHKAAAASGAPPPASLPDSVTKARVFPPKPKVEKVLLLGSGATSIGAAGEFDFTANSAQKSLKEEGVKLVVMNPNVASVQTNMDDRSPSKPDSVYFLPLTADFVEMVIKREKPDGIVVSMGGQTALNVGIELQKRGVFERYGVKVLGSSIDSIIAAEDRQIFNDKCGEIGMPVAKSYTATTVDEAVEKAKAIGFPVMIRSAFALGGLGSGICKDEAHLRDMASKAFAITTQVLVERSMLGWREIEYEVVRDVNDNALVCCNMENLDSCGIHTGDSIVVTPSQTLTNNEYQKLRSCGLAVFRKFNIVGEGNIQMALHPDSEDFCIIEINPRLSRSSALASKASGYPLAHVAAKLALGITLPEISNAITRKTTAFFEPALDYCVVKIPRFDLSKFHNVVREIGSAMKSVGETMAIGRTFEESIQKALRMIDHSSIEGFEPRPEDVARYSHPTTGREALEQELRNPTDRRMFAIAYAMQEGLFSIEELHQKTLIDRWFLLRLENISTEAKAIKAHGSLDKLVGAKAAMLRAKKMGFSDRQIAKLLNNSGTKSGATLVTADDVRAARKAIGVVPRVSQIDTLAAEVPAATNYLYFSYHADESDVEFKDPKEAEKTALILGSGVYRIGSSVEFDCCSVSAVRTLRQLGFKTSVLNYNPETVSTDFDESDSLYFDELSLERVLDVVDSNPPNAGVIVSVAGQIPNNLALPLHQRGVKILGTSPVDIDRAEDRSKFSALMDSIGVKQPPWSALTSREAALEFSERVGYPVLVRPSYVLSGAAMSVVEDSSSLMAMLDAAVSVSQDHPVVISKFISGAEEIEFDGVADRGNVVAHAISQHCEAGGVHSGDATLILPPQTLSPFYIAQTKEIARKVAKALNVTGPMNMQLLAKGGDVMVIEANIRASRSFPFVSKTLSRDFIDAATRVMLGKDVSHLDLPGLDIPKQLPTNFVAVKAPMFSFTRLRGADPRLGVEMASTGEVGCFGQNLSEAFLKALLSSNFKLPKPAKQGGKPIFLSAQADFLPELVHSAFKLHRAGFELLATPKTARYLNERGVPTNGTTTAILGADPSAASSQAVVSAYAYPDDYSDASLASWSALQLIRQKKVDLVVNINGNKPEHGEGNKIIRRAAVDFALPLLTNMKLVAMLSDALEEHHTKNSFVGLQPEALGDYYRREKASDAWTSPAEFH